MPRTNINYQALYLAQRKEVKALKALVAELALLLAQQEAEIETEWVYAPPEPTGHPERDGAQP